MSNPDRPLRLGFPVKVMGVPGLKGNDTRRWQKGPHLKCSLEHVDKILDYLKKVDLDMYRLSSDLAPYATHPDMPQFHNMVAESDAELAAFGPVEVSSNGVPNRGFDMWLRTPRIFDPPPLLAQLDQAMLHTLNTPAWVPDRVDEATLSGA